MQIKVQFIESGEYLTGFTVSGHDVSSADAEFSVLCAAVSSAVQLTCNTLTEYFGVPENAVRVHASRGMDNRISLRIPSVNRVQSDILRGLYLHMTVLSEDTSGMLALKTVQRTDTHN